MKLILLSCLTALALACLPARSFGYGLTFEPSAGISQRYDSNVLFSASNSDVVHDAVSILTGGLKGDMSDGKDTLDMNGSMRLSSYRSKPELDSLDFFTDASASHAFTERTGISGALHFSQDSSPDQELQSTGLILGTSRRDIFQYEAKGTHSLSELISSDISLNGESDRYQSDAYTDTASRGMDLGFSGDAGRLLSSSVVRLDLIYTEYGYTGSTLQDAKSYEWHLGAMKRVSEVIDLTFYVGQAVTVSRYDTPTPSGTQEEKSTSQNWIGELDLGYRTETTLTKLTLANIMTNATGSAAMTDRSVASVTSGVSFTEKTGASVSFGYIRNKTTNTEAYQENIDQHTLYIQPSLSWEFRDDFFLRLSEEYTLLDDHANHEFYRRNLLSLGIEYRPTFHP